MRVVVERATWLRGEGSLNSRLLREGDGKMCCLGFVGLACGYRPEDILGMSSPLSVLKIHPGLPDLWPGNFFDKTQWISLTTRSMMGTNDDVNLTDDVREADLRELAAEVGIELTFV